MVGNVMDSEGEARTIYRASSGGDEAERFDEPPPTHEEDDEGSEYPVEGADEKSDGPAA